MKILITGGAGFIGSHLTKKFIINYPNYSIFNLDSLSYAGNLENLKEVENQDNYTFIKGDITNTFVSLSSVFSIFIRFSTPS